MDLQTMGISGGVGGVMALVGRELWPIVRARLFANGNGKAAAPVAGADAEHILRLELAGQETARLVERLQKNQDALDENVRQLGIDLANLRGKCAARHGEG